MNPNVYEQMVTSKKILDEYKNQNSFPSSQELRLISQSVDSAKMFLQQLKLPTNIGSDYALAFAIFIQESLYQ